MLESISESKVLKKLWKYMFPSNGNHRPSTSVYWPDERPISTLLANLEILTKAGALPPWQNYPHKNSAIRISMRTTDFNTVIGETVNVFFGFTVTVYLTLDKDDYLFYLLFIKSEENERLERFIESKEHRSQSLRRLYEANNSGLAGSEKLSHAEIDRARQRALISLNSIFPS